MEIEINLDDSKRSTEFTFEDLTNQKRKEIFHHLDKIDVITILVDNKEATLYRCADVMKLLSRKYKYDFRHILKRNIGIIKHDKIINNTVRSVTYFLQDGLEYYIYNCDIFNYDLVCEYFKIKYINKEHLVWGKELKKMSTPKGYKTSSVLYWLFKRRKQCKALTEYAKLTTIANAMKECDDVDKEKIDYLLMQE